MINVAIDAAKLAGALAYRYFKTQPKVSYKADNTPVTRADIEAEKLIRKIITKKFPDHGIIGEELPPVNPKAKYQWIIDPIDGTKSFFRGVVYWSTLIALLEDNIPVIGISFFPATNEFFIAQKNKGTYLNGKRTKVSKTQKIEDAFTVHGAITHFKRINKIKELIALADLSKSLSGFSWSLGHYLLLKGKCDILLETGKIYDFAAPKILVEEAGGKFSDFKGENNLASGTSVATNGLLHSKVIKLLNSN